MNTSILKPPRSVCPINLMLESLGDAWSLLIVRDMMFFGATRFNELRGAREKIASNILTDRLQKLEAAAIISKRNDPTDARKFIYELTEKGWDLAPILAEIVLWSHHYEDSDIPLEVVQSIQTDRAAFLAKIKSQQR
ncbi:MAG: helix-turn-helix transcriptional regulator [Sideroxydans sp.]|nr:helix-turn-helix transcriptional regulator [Sideroxydans sp.]